MRRWWLVVLAGLVLAACGEDAPAPAARRSATPTSSPAPATTTAGLPPPGRVPGHAAEVVDVVDGDTIHVVLRPGREETVRLIGINAPEHGECLADRATRRLGELVAGRRVRLARDVSDRDQYGRLLRYVSTGERFVNRVLVVEGLALSRAYPPDTARQAELDRAQRIGRAAGAGLWAPDACGPATTADVAVGAARTDPPGDESQTPNEEWVEVVNRGARAVDLTGWGLRDESASHRYTFPDGFRLGPGARVRIHTGCGPDTVTDLHWCVSGSAVWNNDGDTAFVTDPRGNIVDQRPV